MAHRTALMIIDVQHLLCHGRYACFDIENVIERLNGLIRDARAASVPVLFVQHEENEEGGLQHGSEAWQLDSRLDAQPGEPRIRKTAADSFHRTDLDALLRMLGIRHLVIGGLQSDYCVDTTVRRALSSGYDVTLVSDGHSTIDDGELTAAQISAHHTRILSHLQNFGPRMATAPAASIRFARQDA
ncbi:cysteine hydrolase family protein [Roseateles terrae]|uniref:Nicotinamidase-related amidase n=1 Tax=Roseateles terrae TaxID=431060 RepID=A0ABR6GTV9_9BURK|nr:cysteine hydrolase family protein [Roseateles terrae]MBB3195536.1 nicotinamidase-related amidase [Roseateles terrae]OWQ86452.1 cysteine hydrolase [Roseateles terrae]